MTPLVTIAVGLILAVALWRWSLRDAESAERLTIAVLLGVMATAFNIVVPVPNIEATTLVVLCVAMTLGPGAAVLTAMVAVVGTGVTGGLGLWTAWQVVGYAVLAGGAALATARVAMPSRVTTVLVAVVATIVYDVLVTLSSISTLGIATGDGWGSAALAAMLLGVPYTVTHIIGNAVLSWLGGPSLLRALARARARIATA